MKVKETEMHTIKIFSFRVSGSKQFNTPKLSRQLTKVRSRIIENHNIGDNETHLEFGLIEDDFLKNQFRAKLSFIEEKTNPMIIGNELQSISTDIK